MPTTCREIMTQLPISADPETSIYDIALSMSEFGLGALPIVDKSMCLIGIVTDRDIVTKAVASNLDNQKTPVKIIMTNSPVCCHPEEDIQNAIALMEDCQVRRIPIIDEGGRLVGIISQADIALRLHKGNVTAEVLEEISKTPFPPHSYTGVPT